MAIGTGRNLPLYPADVTLTGIELSPAMLAIARQRAADLGLNVDLRTGDAQALPFDDETFATVVCALSLCTMPDPATTIGEMRRDAWWAAAAARPHRQQLAADEVGCVDGPPPGLR